ncbi:ABC-2 type transport system permease protein [Streptomyces sp. 1114.5]|uniref:ABC transporter permease n=1 Tax=Streptomyces sp. 1114.5 TaxID=1938830 RepID=UPI000EB5C398|nr:ABC transporter permease [Streptomyces sp. 1114.5]RKT16820.1 ABC-2 type transport system permease protein [Streptomyces sp. 1114.5]
MTTAAPGTAAPAAGPQSSTGRRLLALGRAETTLLLRNRTALFTALLLPLFLVASLHGTLAKQAEDNPGLDVDSLLVYGSVGMMLAFVVYYNLTAAYVARRGELVLKRLRTGEARDIEILLGTAVPSLTLGLLMAALIGIGGSVGLHLSVPVNPVLMLLGLVLILATMIALAALSSAFTKTVESAGITTLPVMLVLQLGSGLFIPLEVMPDRLADVCRLLPTTPAFQLIRIGWFGTDGSAAATGFAGSWGTAAPHVVTAAIWLGLAVWGAVRYFRWEPRR